MPCKLPLCGQGSRFLDDSALYFVLGHVSCGRSLCLLLPLYSMQPPAAPRVTSAPPAGHGSGQWPTPVPRLDSPTHRCAAASFGNKKLPSHPSPSLFFTCSSPGLPLHCCTSAFLLGRGTLLLYPSLSRFVPRLGHGQPAHGVRGQCSRGPAAPPCVCAPSTAAPAVLFPPFQELPRLRATLAGCAQPRRRAV